MTIKKLLKFHLLKLCFLTCLMVQCCQLLKSYFHYPTVQKVDMVTKADLTIPSITYCHGDQGVLKTFVKQLSCVRGNKIPLVDVCSKSKKDGQFVYTKRDEFYCATYFTKMGNKTNETALDATVLLIIRVSASDVVKLVSVHSPAMPPQLVDLVSPGCLASIHAEVTNEISLPAPFDTNCINYDSGQTYKSEWDCKLRCQKKGQLYFSNLESANNSQSERKKPSKGCIQKCPKDCKTEHYKTQIMYSQTSKDFCDQRRHMVSVRLSVFRSTSELYITHLQLITFQFLIVQIGGLISLWFGVSIRGILSRSVSLFKYSGHVFMIICQIFCFFQNFHLVYKYLKYQTVTQIVVESTSEKIAFWPAMNIEVHSNFLLRTSNWKNAQKSLKTSVKCDVNFWNKTTSAADFNSGVDGGIFLVTYLYDRKDLKSIRFSFDVKKLERDFHSPVNLQISFSKSPLFDLSHHNIKVGYQMKLKISQKTFRRLPSPYDTNCFNYEDMHSASCFPNDKYFSHGLCVAKCYHGMIEQKLHCTNLFKYLRINKANPNNFTWPNFCPPEILRSKIATFTRQCLNQCPSPCIQYDYKIEEKFEEIKNSSGGIAEVKIVLDNTLVTVLDAEPQMTRFDLFYEVCSLIGLWLGWSIQGFLFAVLLLIRCLANRIFVFSSCHTINQ